MSLLIGSVFMDHPRSKIWYDLQIKYIKDTTNDFKHIVYLNGQNNFYKESEVIKVNCTNASDGQYSHIRGLNEIIDYFKVHKEYDNLLLIDSDCFPFRSWEKDLQFNIKNKFGIAAIARYENLDTFAHPSFFYATREQVENLKFDKRSNINIVGHEFKDTSSNLKESFYPLIRSNKINYHPVLCGVYWNRIYHHGAGSRNLEFRLFYHYFNENNNVSNLEKKLFEELTDNSDKFIKKISLPVFTRKLY